MVKQYKNHFLKKYNCDEVTTSKNYMNLNFSPNPRGSLFPLWYDRHSSNSEPQLLTDRGTKPITTLIHRHKVDEMCSSGVSGSHRSYWVSSMVARREKVHAVLSLMSAGMSDFSS